MSIYISIPLFKALGKCPTQRGRGDEMPRDAESEEGEGGARIGREDGGRAEGGGGIHVERGCGLCKV